jgi:hypothetical protein
MSYREFWINFPISYPDSPDKLATVDDIPLSDSIHAIEYSALQAEQERHIDDVAKLQKELNEARADIDRLQVAWEKAVSSEGDWACIADERQKQITELREALGLISIMNSPMGFAGCPAIAREVINKTKGDE